MIPHHARKERPRVLLVEDNKNLREVLSRLLDLNGWEVVACRGSHEAHAALATHYGAYDAAIVDLMLGDGHGAEVIRSLRLLSWMDATRVVVCSAAESGGRLIREAIEAGADAVHYKPIAFFHDPDRTPPGGLLPTLRGEEPGDVVIPGRVAN